MVAVMVERAVSTAGRYTMESAHRPAGKGVLSLCIQLLLLVVVVVVVAAA